MSLEYQSKYTEVGGLTIAYQIWGNSNETLIYVPGMISHLEAALEDPEYIDWIRTLSKKFKVIIFDKRGQGLSDRDSSAPNIEERMDDISAIVRTEGLDKFYLFGLSEGAAISLLYAATFPQRVKSVAVFGGTSLFTRKEDYKFLPSKEELIESFVPSWGQGNSGYLFFPHRMPERKNEMAKMERMVCNPRTLKSILELLASIDIRATLPDIKLPVLVMHNRDDRAISRHNGRYLADKIPGAKYIEYPIGGHLPWLEARTDIIKDSTSFYLKNLKESGNRDRNLATIMFTDIENSTKQMADLGDKKWSEIMNLHDEVMKITLKELGGKFLKNTGDGVLSVFDGPIRSIECATVCIQKLKRIGLNIRCGLHFGEVHWRNEDVTGIAVNIAARVLDHSDSGQITITKNLKDLLGDVKFATETLGEYNLKGLDGNWELFIIKQEET